MSDDILQPGTGNEQIDIEELIAVSGLKHEEAIELVELGVLEVCGGSGQLAFASRTILQARRAVRLRDDFGLNTPGMGLAPGLTESPSIPFPGG